MSGTVGDVSNEVEVLALLSAQQTVNGLDDHLDDVNVLPLIEATYIISIGNLTLMEDKVDGTGMIFYEQPVSHVESLPIDGERLAMADVINKKRYQLLGELVGTVVVRAVGHDHGHAVGVVEGADKMITRCLRSAVGRMRIVLRCLQEELVTIGQMMLG